MRETDEAAPPVNGAAAPVSLRAAFAAEGGFAAELATRPPTPRRTPRPRRVPVDDGMFLDEDDDGPAGEPAEPIAEPSSGRRDSPPCPDAATYRAHASEHFDDPVVGWRCRACEAGARARADGSDDVAVADARRDRSAAAATIAAGVTS